MITEWIFDDTIKSIGSFMGCCIIETKYNHHEFETYDKDLFNSIMKDFGDSNIERMLFKVHPNSFTGSRISSGILVDYMSFKKNLPF